MAALTSEAKYDEIMSELHGLPVTDPKHLAKDSAIQNCIDSVALGEFKEFSEDWFGCWLSTYYSAIELIEAGESVF